MKIYLMEVAMEAIFAVLMLAVVRLILPVAVLLLVGTLIQRRVCGRIY